MQQNRLVQHNRVMPLGMCSRILLALLAALLVVGAPLSSWTGPTAYGAAKCKVPKATVKYGAWRVTVTSFRRNANNLVAPPSGRVIMAVEVVVSNTRGGSAPGRLLDINLQPTGARRYRGTIVRGEVDAQKDLEANVSVRYTVAFPVELKDKAKPLSIELADYGGGGPEDDLLVAVCR
jgi:hypothetical protein